MSRERPILFSGPMVRALLDGLKTQTRRPVETRMLRHPLDYIGPSGDEYNPDNWGWFFDGPDHHGYMVLGRGHDERHNNGRISIPCPYGEPGDRLWVRETWHQESYSGRDLAAPEPLHEVVIRYAADGASRTIRRGEATHGGNLRKDGSPARQPSIFMPRWASRITLEVTDVRAQWLPSISDDEARAEGVVELPLQEEQTGAWWTTDVTAGANLHGRTPREAFFKLWDSIYGGHKQWVWALTTRSVDATEARAA